jgi:DNA-binding LacI/PurR family transcriptional regulator
MVEVGITFKKMAAQANVLWNTVDGVLHGRGQATPENRKKIEYMSVHS